MISKEKTISTMISKEKNKKLQKTAQKTVQKIATPKNNSKKLNKKLLHILLEKPWEKYIYNFNLIKEKEKVLSKETLEKKKKIIALNQNLEKLKNSKLSIFFFKPWIKNKIFFRTKRQNLLKELYAQYRKTLFLNERKNFFKTHFGEILKKSYLHSPTMKAIWIRAKILARYTPIKRIDKFCVKKAPWLLTRHHTKQYSALTVSMQKGWLYENLLKKEESRNAIYFDLDRPNTAFQNNFKQKAKEPWVDPLIFKRWAYFGFLERNRKEKKQQQLKLKEYLRKRNPRQQKRNKLYWWRRNLLFKFYLNNQIKKKKAKRIKKILTKIYLPFYGNFNQKQLTALLKKKKKKKSKFLSKNETILSSLENRLDVVVYRLNLAPNILWARRLIQEGSIFVNNIFSFQNWVLMYSQIKHFIFPLKLRDPKNLYKTKQWNPTKKISKFKFFLKPVKKIHYLVQSGDLIQSAKMLNINKFKNNLRLFRKPIKKNLYTIKKIKKYIWSNSAQAPKAYSFFKWKEPSKQMTASLFLFNARFTDLKTNDRARELFFRWVTL